MTEICTVSFTVIGLCGIAISLFSIFGGRFAFSLLGVPEDVMQEACDYLAIVGGFSFVQGVYMTLTAILRSHAMLKEVMVASAVMNGVNILGNAVLINGAFFFPRLGVVGAAISTDLSKCVGLLIVVFIFLKKTDVRISFRLLRPFPRESLKSLLAIGLPTGMESLSYTLAQTIIMSFINSFGTAVIATKVYCSILANVSYIYTLSIAQATQIVVSYLVGAKEPERINRRVWSTIPISISVSFSVMLLLYLNSDFVFRIFTDDPEIIALGHKILFVELFLEIGRAVNIVMVRCLIATGDVKAPVIAGILSAWGLAVTFSYIFGVYFGYGLIAIWAVMACDECLRGTVFIIRFLGGKWRRKLLTE